MPKRKFKCNILSKQSVEQLQKDLEAYIDDLSVKCEKVVRRLAEIGLAVAEEEIAKAGYTYDADGHESGSNTEHTSDINVSTSSNSAKADLVVSGEDILFIEFGAGVYYNGEAGKSPHPKGKDFGFVIGSYGKGNGIKKLWGYYDDSGTFVLTHGTEATMPMYKAALKMYEEAPNVVKEIFGG
jgi:hypothetical protein